MKTNRTHWLTASALLALATFILQPSTAFAQGTAFTYQGRLNDGSGPANGTYDLRFALFDAQVAGTQQGNLLTNSAVAVSNGLFTVTLDFGNQFPGATRWLEIGVRSNGVASFTTLTPRQPLTPAPYAVTAANVVSGGLTAGTYGSAVILNNSANQISGAFAGDGTSVTNVNAMTLGGISSAGFWKTNGNIGANPTNGAYIGTADNLPVEFRADGKRALRLEYAFDAGNASVAPNVIGGSVANVVSNGVYGAFIGGGTQNGVGGDYGSILGGAGNTASGHYSTAIGGENTANNFASTAMGYQSQANGSYSTAMGLQAIAGGSFSTAMGEDTTASRDYSTAMGESTTASGFNSTAMGTGTTASENYSTAIGFNTIASGIVSIAMGNTTTASGGSSTTMGLSTIASGNYSTAMGSYAQAADIGSFVWADHSSSTYFTSSAANQFLLRATGGVGINTANPGSPLTVKTATSSAGIEQTDGNIRIATYVGGSTGGGWIGTLSNHKLSFYVNNGSPSMTVSTNGDVGIGTTSPTHLLQVGTAYCDGSSWVNVSDRNLKQDFARVDAATVLEKVVALPVQSWSYKAQPGEQHIGPVAQDFHAAFGLGDSDRAISTVDENGVALAAIQGLNEKLETDLKAKDMEIQDLKSRLDRLEQLVSNSSEK